MRKVWTMQVLVGVQLAIAGSAGAQMPQHSHEHSPRSRATISPAVKTLLDRADSAIEAYADRRVAIANGYRLVGKDLPSMGEHWLNTRLLIDGVLDVAKPELLTYVKIDGRPVLTGVVYAVPLQQGESPPAVLGPDAVWHEHNGAVDDEALLPEHHNTPSAMTGTRVAFVHAWLRVPHPDGIFGAENWAMPFVRAGLPVPGKYPSGAARALGLIGNGRTFFAALIGPSSGESTSEPLDRGAEVATLIASAARSENRGLTVAELEQLAAAWDQLLKEVARQSGFDAMKRINGGKLAPD